MNKKEEFELEEELDVYGYEDYNNKLNPHPTQLKLTMDYDFGINMGPDFDYVYDNETDIHTTEIKVILGKITFTVAPTSR